MNELALPGFNAVSPRTERRILVAIGVSILVHVIVLGFDIQREIVFSEPAAPTLFIRSVSRTEAPPATVTRAIEAATEAKLQEQSLPPGSAPPVIKHAKSVPTLVPNWRQLGKSAAPQAARQEPAYRPMNRLPAVDFEPPRSQSARKPFLESYLSIYGDAMARYGKHCFIYRQPSPFEASTASTLMLVTRC